MGLTTSTTSKTLPPFTKTEEVPDWKQTDIRNLVDKCAIRYGSYTLPIKHYNLL